MKLPDGRNRRVLIVTNGWPTPEYPEYAIFNARQVDDLRALGRHDVEVEFINARARGKVEYLRRIPQIRRAAQRADIVHCYHGLSFLLTRQIVPRKPLVVSFLNALEHEFAEQPRRLARILEARCRTALARGGQGVIFKDAVPMFLRADPLVRHVANGVDMQAFQPLDKSVARTALGLDAETIYLLFVSSKSLDRPQKRHDRFVQVLDAYRARHPDQRIAPLTLVGATADVVRKTLHAADVKVMTSDFEGSPNSVKEAMASGLPVVSTDVGNVRSMLEGEAAGRVIAPFDVTAMCDGIDAVRATTSHDRLALRARLLHERLDAPSVARRIADLYEDVIAEHLTRSGP